jgi:hypothetical protein
MEEGLIQELKQKVLELLIVYLELLEELHSNIRNIIQVQYVLGLPLVLLQYSYLDDLDS